VAWLYPKQWNGRAVVWLDDGGKAAIQNDRVKALVKAGAAVLGVDLLLQGGEHVKQTAVVKNPREFAGYTHGYNHALFAQRTHDVLSIISFLRNAKVGSQPNPKTIAIAGWGQTGPIVAAARALAGEAVDRAAVDTNGFRFGKVLDYRSPMFLPGGAKYLDLPGIIALNAPHALWIAGEGGKPELFGANFGDLMPFAGVDKDKQSSAIEWLLK
jgi:hypothetical protein